MPIIQLCDDYDEFFAAVTELSVGHWQETEAAFSARPPEPNRDIYTALADAGALIIMTVTDGEALVGYASAVISPHPHYDMLVAQHDTLYLAPAYRLGSLGLRLMSAIEREAVARGAERMMWHAKPGSTFARLVERMGYAPEETIYHKELPCPQPSSQS